MFDTIAAAAAGLRSGATTSRVLVDRCLEAVDRRGAETAAFTTVHRDRARDAARAVDEERAQGIDRGPLHGIPISLKDLIDEAGVVTTGGSHVLDDRVAPADATLVARLRKAGAIVLGRTNLHEFALGTTSEDSAFGPVRHPLDPTRIAGGSSGGSAVAVATGMGLASVGTDTGGSVRIPAAICGTVGLKPGYGEIPTEGMIPLSVSFDHVGPLARTVQDAAWMFAAMAGQPPVPIAARRPDGLCLRQLVGYFDAPLEPAVRAAFDAAICRLVEEGVRIRYGEIPGASAIHEFYVNVMLPEGACWHAPHLDARAHLYTPVVRDRFRSGLEISAVTYLQATAARAAYRDAVDDAFVDCDALILPALPLVAPPLGTHDVVIDGQTLPLRTAMLKHTQLFNMTGHPAISLPMDVNGLPAGVQLVGRRGQTASLLEIAAAIEPHLRTS